MHSIDRISHEEEVRLSRAIQRSLSLSAEATALSKRSVRPRRGASRSLTFEDIAADLDLTDDNVHVGPCSRTLTHMIRRLAFFIFIL